MTRRMKSVLGSAGLPLIQVTFIIIITTATEPDPANSRDGKFTVVAACVHSLMKALLHWSLKTISETTYTRLQKVLTAFLKRDCEICDTSLLDPSRSSLKALSDGQAIHPLSTGVPILRLWYQVIFTRGGLAASA